MRPSAEALLMLAIAGLYFFDSVVLVYCNECLLWMGRHWRIGFGSDRWRVGTKEVFTPNPLAFHRPIHKLSWRMEGGPPGEPWKPDLRVFGSLVPMAIGIFFGLFVYLPLGLFTSLGDTMLILALVMTYGSILAAILRIWWIRKLLNLSNRQVGALLFEYLACPPFAINVVRHLSLKVVVTEDAVAAARRLLTPERWLAAQAEFVARIDDEILAEDRDSRRMLALQARRSEILGETAPESSEAANPRSDDSVGDSDPRVVTTSQPSLAGDASRNP